MGRPTLKKQPAKSPPTEAHHKRPRPLSLLPTKQSAQRWTSSSELRGKPDRYMRQAKTPLIRQLSTWTVDDVLSAQEAHERGEFDRSGLLWLWMQRTSRLKAVLRKRTGALPSLPFTMEPAKGGAESTPQQNAIAAYLEQHWQEICPESLLRGIIRQSIGMGAALCRVSWRDDGRYWWPCLTLWPADAYYYQDSDCTWYARTREGGDIKVTPGKGWFLWLPDGPFSFQQGAVLSLAIPCLMSSLSDSDWANYNAANSVVIRLAEVPRGATRASKDLFLDNVEELGRSTSTLLCEKNIDKSGFGMTQLDTQTGNLDTFQRSKEVAEKQITIEILGQEKTTDLGGEGARSAVESLQGVEDAIIGADAEGFSTAFRQQVLMQMCLLNWGDGDLAPWPHWEVESTPEISDKATGWVATADAIAKWDTLLSTTDKQVDRAALAEQIGVLLQERPPSDAPVAASPVIRVGDIVRVRSGKEHDDMTRNKTGVVREISSAALAIEFEGMPEWHRWYTAEELEQVPIERSVATSDLQMAPPESRPLTGPAQAHRGIPVAPFWVVKQ